MWTFGYSGLQRLGQLRGPRVRRDALLHIGPEQICSWAPHPLGQTSQCLPLLTIQERQTGGRVEDFPGGGLSRSRRVVCRWVKRWGVGCLFHSGVSKSLCDPWDERYAVWSG